MRQMTSFEYMKIVEELASLVGQRIEKFIDYGEKSYRFRIGKSDIAIDAPLRMNITKYIKDSPATPADFAFAVRKRIENGRLAAVSLHEADRVVVFKIEKDNEIFELVFEMFSSGNCALVGLDGVCIVAAEHNEWKDREIKPKKPYQFPKSQVTRDKMFDVEGAISGKFISACLSRLPIGTMYTNEALERCGIGQKTVASELDKNQVAQIEKTLREIVEKPVPVIYTEKDGTPCEFALTEIWIMKGKEAKRLGTFSECIDEFYKSNRIVSKTAPVSAEDKELARLREVEAKQSEHIQKLAGDAESASASGKAILENLELVDAAIEYAKKGKLSEHEKMAKVQALEKSGKLKIDKKTGILEIEL